MSKWKQMVLGDMGHTYGGLTNKTIVDFGFGKPFIPYMNIFSNGKINPKFLVLVNIHPGERQNTVKYGDLFFTTSSETVEEVGMTSVLLDDIGEAYLNSFCFGFRLNNFDDLLPEFAPFLFRGLELRKKISLFGQGSTRYNLPKTELLAKLKIDLPTIPEQRKIAKILSTTDTVIEKTQAAIAKYKAIKQGMLNDLFTRGIDIKTGRLRPKYEDAPELYKESELGWIPIEWDILVLGEKVLSYAGGTPSRSREDFFKGKIPWISSSEVNQDEISKTKEYITEEALNNSSAKLVPKDSVLIALYGATAGQISYLRIEATTNQAVLACLNSETIDSKFLYYLLSNNKDRILYRAQGSGQPNLSKQIIDELNFAVPQINEQNEIYSRLNVVDNKLNIEKKFLQKIQQTKSGLMADLLSGNKIVTA